MCRDFFVGNCPPAPVSPHSHAMGEFQLYICFKSKLEGRESGPSSTETEDCGNADRRLRFRGDSQGPSSEKLDGYAWAERDKGTSSQGKHEDRDPLSFERSPYKLRLEWCLWPSPTPTLGSHSPGENMVPASATLSVHPLPTPPSTGPLPLSYFAILITSIYFIDNFHILKKQPEHPKNQRIHLKVGRR